MNQEYTAMAQECSNRLKQTNKSLPGAHEKTNPAGTPPASPDILRPPLADVTRTDK
jgi:hypothetical protein